jgi:CMP-2-keto-3-deoxyoctulosonic acid synthetase
MSSLENGRFEEQREDLNEVEDTSPSENAETEVCGVEVFYFVEQTIPFHAFAQSNNNNNKFISTLKLYKFEKTKIGSYIRKGPSALK